MATELSKKRNLLPAASKLRVDSSRLVAFNFESRDYVGYKFANKTLVIVKTAQDVLSDRSVVGKIVGGAVIEKRKLVNQFVAQRTSGILDRTKNTRLELKPEWRCLSIKGEYVTVVQVAATPSDCLLEKKYGRAAGKFESAERGARVNKHGIMYKLAIGKRKKSEIFDADLAAAKAYANATKEDFFVRARKAASQMTGKNETVLAGYTGKLERPKK